ncbi:MAG: hypothetical protein ISS92_04060 [Candidatus Omnitrophica bacterium]|nr:hypothetical protein [Candidatus Omnitrophota bacterium]
MKIKEIPIIAAAVIVVIFNLFYFASYANAKTENSTSATSTENENQKESNLNNEEESVSSSDAKAAKVRTLASLPGEIFSGSVGKGVLLSPLLSESFQTDLATGSATVSISIVVPPGRKNMQPNIALSYSSNNPNGVCGVGWGLTTSSIQRSTKKGTPKYNDTDTFVFASSGSSGELVLIDNVNNEYRQKIETAFMKYVFDRVNLKWIVWDKGGTKYTFGGSANSRITDNSGTKIFAWFLDSVEDVYGNTVLFTYEKDESQVYLSRVEYVENSLASPALPADKSVEFIYETGRPDILYNYRSGWKIQTNKRLKEIHIKVDNGLIWRYVLDYKESIDTDRSLLSKITLFDADGNSLPPKEFTYQTIE